MTITLRKASREDLPFLIALREQTMAGYLKEAGMPTEREHFIQRIQDKFDDAYIILNHSDAVGLFKFFFLPSEQVWFVGQIQVSPAFQGQGIGAQLLSALIRHANDQHKSVRLKVLKNNPARRLYEQVGFKVVGETHQEFVMETPPHIRNSAIFSEAIRPLSQLVQSSNLQRSESD